MPEMLATPAPAAPSSPAPSASPASTPAPSTPAPSTPSTDVTTGAQPAPVTTETPAGDQGWKGKDRPKSHDYDGDISKFLKDELAWEGENPQAEEPFETAAEAKPAEATTEQAEAKTEETAEAAKAPEFEGVASPDALATLVNANPARKAYLESDPEFKGEIYAMSRRLARAEPIAEMFPTVEDATFANETANRTVGIKSAFERAAVQPETIGAAIDALADEFTIVDEKGQPVLDAEGNKQYGDDFRLMVDHLADLKYQSKVGDIKEAMASGKLNEAQKNNYQAAMDAWEFLQKFEALSDFERGLPDQDGMDEATKNWVNQESERLKKERDEIEGKGRQQKTEQDKQAQASYEKNIRVSAAKSFGSNIDKLVKGAQDSGVYIPEYLLQEVDTVSKVNVFVKGIYDQFMLDTVGWSESARRYVAGKGVPRLKEKLAKLESMPRSEQAQKAREDFYSQIQSDFLPKIFSERLKKIQGYAKSERTKAAEKSTAARAGVAPEIAGGSTSSPNQLSEAAAMKQAYIDVDKKNGETYVDPSERTRQALRRQMELLNGAR